MGKRPVQVVEASQSEMERLGNIKQSEVPFDDRKLALAHTVMNIVTRFSVFLLCFGFLTVHGSPDGQSNLAFPPTARTRNGTSVGAYLPQFNQDAFYGVPFATTSRFSLAEYVKSQCSLFPLWLPFIVGSHSRNSCSLVGNTD